MTEQPQPEHHSAAEIATAIRDALTQAAEATATSRTEDAAEVRAITEAMVRLLIGVPLRSNGQLTVKSLAEEAGLCTCSRPRWCTSTPCCCRRSWKSRASTTSSARMSGALTPLFWTHINPYGRFRLDMSTRLDLAGAPATGTGGRETVL